MLSFGGREMAEEYLITWTLGGKEYHKLAFGKREAMGQIAEVEGHRGCVESIMRGEQAIDKKLAEFRKGE